MWKHVYKRILRTHVGKIWRYAQLVCTLYLCNYIINTKTFCRKMRTSSARLAGPNPRHEDSAIRP